MPLPPGDPTPPKLDNPSTKDEIKERGYETEFAQTLHKEVEAGRVDDIIAEAALASHEKEFGGEPEHRDSKE